MLYGSIVFEFAVIWIVIVLIVAVVAGRTGVVAVLFFAKAVIVDCDNAGMRQSLEQLGLLFGHEALGTGVHGGYFEYHRRALRRRCRRAAPLFFLNMLRCRRGASAIVGVVAGVSDEVDEAEASLAELLVDGERSAVDF